METWLNNAKFDLGLHGFFSIILSDFWSPLVARCKLEMLGSVCGGLSCHRMTSKLVFTRRIPFRVVFVGS